MGASFRLRYVAPAEAIKPRNRAGHIIFQVPVPAARMAMTSLSPPILPKPMIVPARIDNGKVKIRTAGSSATLRL